MTAPRTATVDNPGVTAQLDVVVAGAELLVFEESEDAPDEEDAEEDAEEDVEESELEDFSALTVEELLPDSRLSVR